MRILEIIIPCIISIVGMIFIYYNKKITEHFLKFSFLNPQIISFEIYRFIVVLIGLGFTVTGIWKIVAKFL